MEAMVLAGDLIPLALNTHLEFAVWGGEQTPALGGEQNPSVRSTSRRVINVTQHKRHGALLHWRD
jgi:hypothetical protein